MLGAAAVLSAAALLAKSAAERWLPPEEDSAPVALLDLRLAENHGVAFSVGNTLDAWMIAAPIAGVTALLLAYICTSGWKQPWLLRWGLAAIQGGAAANLIDRLPDGAVTDYLYTGWFPTFNVADCLITVGAALLAVGALRGKAESTSHATANGQYRE